MVVTEKIQSVSTKLLIFCETDQAVTTQIVKPSSVTENSETDKKKYTSGIRYVEKFP